MSHSINSPTKVLAKYLATADPKELPSYVFERSAMCVLDWVGAVIGGLKEDSTRVVRKFVVENSGTEEATAFGTLRRVPAMQAAFVNGVASHALEIDDSTQGLVHAGAVVIPSALAVAQKLNKNGKNFLFSVVLGYETSVRLGKAAGTAHYNYWHSTGTCGTFGAVAAAGWLFGLDESQFISALGLAGTQAAGLWESLNTQAISTKHLHAGKAAMNGILSAHLAKEGIRGAPTILEGPRGFFAPTSVDPQENAKLVVKGLGESYEIMSNIVKLHTSCLANHRAINAAIKIHENQCLKLKEIKSIRIKEYSRRIDMCGISKPKDILQAKFSLPFSIALALKCGKAGFTEYTEKNLNDHEIKALMGKILLLSDSAIPLYGNLDGILLIETKDGRLIQESGNLGVASIEQIKLKFMELMSYFCPGQEAEELLIELDNLKNASSILPFITKTQALAMKVIEK